MSWLKDRLIAGSIAEKEYLKANKLVKSSKDQEQAQGKFIEELGKVGFASIADYQEQVKLYGHYWRAITLYDKYDTSDHIDDVVQDSLRDGKDYIASTLYDHTVAQVPDLEKANDIVDVDYCQKTNVEIVSHFGLGGCYLAEAGGFGILIVLHRPALAEGVERTLKEVMQNVLLNHYEVETYLETNELMTKQFIAHPDGVKIWGDTYANIGKVVMVAGSLTLEFNTSEAKKILKKRPDHPEIKEPHGLNDLLGYKINPAECLKFVLEEWLKVTESVVE